MAKINLPLLSQTAKNRIGDVVFYRRGDFGINVARIRVIPHNPRTVNQTNIRHNLKTLTRIWLGRISPAGAVLYKYNPTSKTWTAITINSNEVFENTEKQAWDAYTHTTKQGYRVKGRLAFVGVNMQRLYNNLDPLKTPTTTFTLTA